MQYIKECLLLLYWIYFKPYTLKQHVQEICPEITDPYKDNFFLRSAEARANPRLKRYDDQCWWLTTLVPMAVAAVAFYDFLSVISFCLLGWLLGHFTLLIIPRKPYKYKVLLVRIAAVALLSASAFLSNNLASCIAIGMAVAMAVSGDFLAVGVMLGVAGVFVGIAVGGDFLAVSVAVGVAGGLWGGLGGGIKKGVIVGVISGVFVGVAIGVAIGVAASVSIDVGVGVILGVAVGVAVGVPFILGVLRFYFWLPELLWMLLLRFWPGKAADKLPCLPPQFDQLIILPLPFLPGIIAQAYQENQAAARQCINYLISSTNQQKTAGKAMLLIAAEEFRRCRKASDIAEVRAQLNWLPVEQAGQITACFDLSQDTAAALESTTPYRQEKRLKQVCAKIDLRRNALAGASTREATTLGPVLDQWQGILTAACRTLHETALRSGELPQVYLPGPTLEPDKAGKLFKGRRDLFRQIESLLLSAQPPTLVMQGNRRSGKSSALRYLPEQMPSDILPLFVDCQGAATSVTLEGLAKHLTHQMVESARSAHSLTLPPPDKDELKTDPFAALLGWLDTVEQAAPGKTFLLCLDEFERIDEIVTATGSRAPLNFLRHLIQHRDRWQLLFAGAHTPDELASHWSDCLINTRSLRVSCLDKDDAMDLICRPVPDFPEIWPEAAAEAVWQLTQGQPYLIQLLCSETIDHLNKRKAKTVQPGDVEAVLPAAFEHGHYYFDEFQRALNEDQRMLLAAVVKGETVPQELEAAAAGLLRKEVLVQENGGYAFRVPLLGRWIAARS